jgi:hypothetical protein
VLTAAFWNANVRDNSLDIDAIRKNVIQGTTTTSVGISATSFTDSGITATITPTSTTSKILVTIVASFALVRASSFPAGAYFQLLRASTALFTDAGAQGSMRLMASNPLQLQLHTRQTFQYLDAPASTSALTYKLQAKVEDANSTITFQNNSVISTIILQEIPA